MAEWKIDGSRLLTWQDGAWIAVEAREVAAAAAEDESFRRKTGFRLGRVALRPYVLVSGVLPDAAKISVGVRRGTDFVPLPDKLTQGVIHASRWHPVDLTDVARCFRVLENHNADDNGRLALGDYLKLQTEPSCADILVDETVHDLEPATLGPPRNFRDDGLTADLFPYQQAGAEFLVRMADRNVGTLLADQMGLGKTIQAIALLLDQRDRGPSLIVCPASLLPNWLRETRHFAPDLSVLNHTGSIRTGVESGLTSYDLVLTSYDTLVSDRAFMNDIAWNIVVLDEAQYIKNPETNRAKSVKNLQRRVSVALTGTPVENRLLDAWSIAEFAVPALLGTKESFEEAFPDEIERAERLGRIISPITLRRLVADVATDLPALINVETALELSERDARTYFEAAATNPSALAVTTRLRVICAHADGGGWGGSYDPVSPKVEHTLRIVDEAFEEGQKVLVFASFQMTLARLFHTLELTRPDTFLGIVDGRVAVSDRQSVIDLFSKFPGPGALLMNPQAAGVGLNITAANHVVHFNPEWNPALTSQATARAYRRKQTKPVTVHHLFYEGTVEEDALLRADWKRELAKSVDEGTSNGEEGQLPWQHPEK